MTAGGDTGRHLDADRGTPPRPRPARDGLVAGRPAVRDDPRERPCRVGGPGGGRRLPVERRRPGPAAGPRGARSAVASDLGLRAHAPGALAGSRGLGIRRPGSPALPAVTPADHGDLCGARRTGHGGGDQRGQAHLPRGVAGIPAGAAGSPAAGAPRRASRRRDATSGRSWPASVAPTRKSCSARSCRRRRAARPSASSCWPSGGRRRLRVEVTAEVESVRVRALRDGVEALDRTFYTARRTDADLLTEAIEADGRDPVAEGTLHAAARLAGGEPAVVASAGADA